MRRPAPANRFRGESGAAAVEFALVLVPLILLMIGIIDFGRAFYTRNNMIAAADRGARIILLDAAAPATVIENEISAAFLAGTEGGLVVQIGTASESGIQFRTLRLSYELDLLTPFIAPDRVTMTHARRVPLG